MGSKPLSYLRGIRLFHDHVGLTALTNVSLLKDFLKLKYMHNIIFFIINVQIFVGILFAKQVALKMSNKNASVNLKMHFFVLGANAYSFSTLMTKKISAEGYVMEKMAERAMVDMAMWGVCGLSSPFI